MSDGHAVSIIPVARVCERKNCNNESEVSMYVTGDVGTDAIAAYCDDCAARLEESENHGVLGKVVRRD